MSGFANVGISDLNSLESVRSIDSEIKSDLQCISLHLYPISIIEDVRSRSSVPS